MVAIEERKERDTVIITGRIGSGGMTCSHRLKNYACELWRAMSMMVAIEERKEKDTVIITGRIRSSGMTCSHRLKH